MVDPLILIYIYIYVCVCVCVCVFSSGSVRIPVLLLSYSGGIDLGIVHSCMYP